LYHSLLYYIYNWGYDQFVKFVKNLKGNKDDKTIRIYEFEYIISYLALEGKMDEIKEIIDTVLSWDMNDEEKSKTKTYIKMAPYWSQFSKGIEKYETEILPLYNIEKYVSGNNW